MPTNDERREIASRLRELVADWFDDGEFYDPGEVEDVLGLATDDGAWYEAAGVRRLADLIEPEERTCTVEHWGGGTFYLSCGHAAPGYPGSVPEFCPNCGAKVVSE